MTSLLAENFIGAFFTNTNTQFGGLKNKMEQPQGAARFFSLFFLFLIIILIKSYIVYLGYNFVMPKLIYSLNQERSSTLEEVQNKFRPITFVESIILTILMNTLLG